MEQRHLWRRAFAVLIDFIILSQLAFYLLVPFADGDRVRLSGGIYPSVSCRIVPLLPEAAEYFRGLGIEAENASLCTSYQNGFYAGTNLLVGNQPSVEGEVMDHTLMVNTPIDRQGEEVDPIYPVAFLAPIVLFLGFVLMTWLWNGQTLGKRITRIQVVSDEGDYLGLRQVLIRETLKFAPAILLFALGLFAPQYTLEQVVPLLQKGENIALVLGFLGVSTFIYILWWVAPLIWWNGAMPYDRINKSMVERTYQ